MEATIAHEIAHQWFGDMATESDWPHLWLSEGFATYMTILYMENKYGQDTALKMRLEDRRQVIAFAKQKAVPVIDTTVKDYMELLNANSYQKGGWILHMLRRSVGDSIFWKGIRTYYDQYAGKNASSDDFRKVMEEVSKKELKTFFNQWLYRPQHPQLTITWQYHPDRKKVWFNIQQSSPFEFPLEVAIVENGQSKIIVIQVSSTSTIVETDANSRPQIIIDPEIHRVHHASDLKYLDKNHGGVLIIWDRIFGTFQKEEEHPVYGLTKNYPTSNPVKIVFQGWLELGRKLAKTRSLVTAIKYILYPPGWSHDGSTKTVKQMLVKSS